MFGTAHYGVLFLDELPEFPRLVLEYSLFKQITNHMHSDPFTCHPNNKNYTKKVTGHKVCSIHFSKFVLNIFQPKTPWTTLKMEVASSYEMLVHSDEQKSIGLKFSKSRTWSHVTYSCHHNLSRFTCPIFFPGARLASYLLIGGGGRGRPDGSAITVGSPNSGIWTWASSSFRKETVLVRVPLPAYFFM